MTWFVFASQDIVGGVVGVSWRDRGSCGASASNRLIAVLPITPIQPRRDGRDGVLSVVSGMAVDGVADIDSGESG